MESILLQLLFSLQGRSLSTSSTSSLGGIPCLLARCDFSQMIFLFMILQQRLNSLESFFNVFSSFSTCQHNFARGKNEQAYFWLLQVIYQTRESLWVEITIDPMFAMVEFLQFDLEVDRATCHHILNSEFGKLYRVTNTLNSFCILFGSLLTILLTLSAGDDHLTILENKCGSPGRLLESHDKRSKSLRIILSISTMITNF